MKIEWRARTLRTPPTRDMEDWKDEGRWNETDLVSGLMTGPVHQIFEHKSEVTKVELIFGEQGIAVQFRRAGQPDWRHLDDDALYKVLKKHCKYGNGRPYVKSDILAMVTARRTLYGQDIIDAKLAGADL